MPDYFSSFHIIIYYENRTSCCFLLLVSAKKAVAGIACNVRRPIQCTSMEHLVDVNEER